MSPRLRALSAIVLSIVAVALAALAARGPAVSEVASFSWPPRQLPAQTPSRTWFSPLLIARHVAKTLDARVPCDKAPALSDVRANTLLLATVREARDRYGLQIQEDTSRGQIVIRVGRTELGRVAESANCSIRVRFDQGAWTIRRNAERALSGTLAAPPSVDGLYTQLDLSARPRLKVSVTPFTQDTHPSAVQTILRVLAAVLIAAAVALVLSIDPVRLWRGRGTLRPRAQDAVVGGALAAWWLLSPLQDDDGWTRARQVNSLASGGFSNYYEHWGVDLPLATWLEWLQHFVVANSSAIAVQRLPSFAALFAAWVLCRWTLQRLHATDSTRLVLWSAALVFVLGSVAFGGTLRPEPMIALLAVGVLACSVRYALEPALAPLVAGVLLTGLAVTVHPSGAVAAAPLVLCVPQMVRDTRARSSIDSFGLGAVASIGLAWTLLLAYLDSDTAARNESVDLIRAGGGHGEGVFQELERYSRLSDAGASPARRLFVAVLLLVAALGVAAYVRRRPLAAKLPASSVGLGLVLLAVNPSKWIWHFGVFVGLCSVAIGFETCRLSSFHFTRPRRVAALVVILALGLWAASDANSWGPLDTGRLDWNHSSEPFLVAVAVAVAAVVAASLSGHVRRPELVVLPAVAVAMAVMTVGLFAADAVATGGWTTARQTISSLVGRDGCGVAASVIVARPDPRGTVIPASVDEHGSSTWYPTPQGAFGIFVGGNLPAHEAVDVSWGRASGGRIVPMGSGQATLDDADPGPDAARWRFVTDDRFPTRPRGADRVRFSVGRTERDRTAVLSTPFAYTNVPLSSLFGRGRALVSPYLFEAIPCAKPMRLAYGVAEQPSILVDRGANPPLTNFSSPVLGLPDVMELQRLPVRSTVDRGPIYVYVVRPDSRDAIAPARMRVIE